MVVLNRAAMEVNVSPDLMVYIDGVGGAGSGVGG